MATDRCYNEPMFFMVSDDRALKHLNPTLGSSCYAMVTRGAKWSYSEVHASYLQNLPI